MHGRISHNSKRIRKGFLVQNCTDNKSSVDLKRLNLPGSYSLFCSNKSNDGKTTTCKITVYDIEEFNDLIDQNEKKNICSNIIPRQITQEKVFTSNIDNQEYQKLNIGMGYNIEYKYIYEGPIHLK